MANKKFSFVCKKCGQCCLERGPIPLVIEDLVMWAKNDVIENIFPYLKFIKTDMGTIDLVLAKTDSNPFGEEEKNEEELCCPLFNEEKKECTIYNYRPLSCRTYPLEYNGENFQIVDSEDPGLNNGEMKKEDLKKMKLLAKKMNKELTKMRISMPIISQAMQPFIIKEMVEAQKKMMEQMSPEERKKFEDQMKKDIN